MPITLITGPANAGKAELVMHELRHHLRLGREPALIVPTAADVAHYRRELAGDGASLGAEVQRFRELIASAVRRAGDGSPLMGAVARERMLGAIAASQRDELGALASSPGLARALVRFVAEAQERRITPQRLRGALSAAPGVAPGARGLATLLERYLVALRTARCVDEEQRALRAFDVLRRKPALWGGRPVLFYGFDDLTRLQLDAIETLGSRVDAPVTVSLTYEPGRAAFAGRASTFHALLPLASRHEQLPARAEHYAPGARAALAHLERSLFEPTGSRADPARAVRLLEGADQRAELELVAAQIAELLSAGMAAGEIAVVTRATPASADLLEEVFAAASIPYTLRRRRRFADSAIGAALIGLLRCVAPAAAGGAPRPQEHRREDEEDAARHLLAWLRAPGVLARPELADRLEALARRAGPMSAQQVTALWEQRHWRVQAIELLAQAQERGPAALAERAARELSWLFAAAHRRQASVLDAEELDEARAQAAGARALVELRELGRVAPQLAARDAHVLADTLQGLELSAGARPSQRAVAVLDPLALRARRVRALFLCGLQEGVFPSSVRPQRLLSEEERRGLAQASGLLLGESEDVLAAERYLLYAAVSRPQELLVLSWHGAGDDGVPSPRSLFVDDVCDLFEHTLEQTTLHRRAAAGVHGARAAGEPGAGAAAPIAPLRDPALLGELGAHTWSASSLGVWMSCPARWLVERLLRARDLDPEAEPLARGGLAHAALKQTLQQLRRETGSARVTPHSLARARELLARALQEHEPEFELSSAPERRPGARRRLHADLERYLEHAAACAGEQGGSVLEPAHLELEFGFAYEGDEGGDEGARECLPPVDIGDGVMLRGRIDRVDVDRSGQAVIYDYKGRHVWPAAKWIAERDLQVALYMRAAERLLGVRAVGGFYQPLSGSDLRARGVLDAGAHVTLPCVGDDARDAREMQALLDDVLAAAREAAAQAARGELEPRPPTCAFKGGCRYPAICRWQP